MSDINEKAKAIGQIVRSYTPVNNVIIKNSWVMPNGVTLESNDDTPAPWQIHKGVLYMVSGGTKKLEVTGFRTNDFSGKIVPKENKTKT